MEADLEYSKKNKVLLFSFEEVWTKEKRCEDLIKKMWLDETNHNVNKLFANQAIENSFRELRPRAFRDKLKRLKDLLKDDSS